MPRFTRLLRPVLGLWLILCAVPVMAQAPANGTWKSIDLGGPVLLGRYSEYWFAGTKLAVNNTVNEQSWDGATLATQWWWYCPWQVAPAALLTTSHQSITALPGK